MSSEENIKSENKNIMSEMKSINRDTPVSLWNEQEWASEGVFLRKRQKSRDLKKDEEGGAREKEGRRGQ